MVECTFARNSRSHVCHSSCTSISPLQVIAENRLTHNSQFSIYWGQANELPTAMGLHCQHPVCAGRTVTQHPKQWPCHPQHLWINAGRAGSQSCVHCDSISHGREIHLMPLSLQTVIGLSPTGWKWPSFGSYWNKCNSAYCLTKPKVVLRFFTLLYSM